MKQRNWFITGISSGLGKALAAEVIAQGDYVIGTVRKEAEAAAFNKKHAGKAKAIILDISQEHCIDSVVEQVIDEYARIDVLVNNAGVGFVGAIEEASLEEIRQVFEVNVFGTFYLTQKFLPQFRKQGTGHIIQISSHAGIKAFAGFGIYNASKFALEGFTEALAQEVQPLSIKVSLVEPGPFRTNFAGAGLQQAKQLIEAYAGTAGAFRQKLLAVHGKQEGDPQKAAQAICQHSLLETPSLRLPLGSIPLTTIQMKLDQVQQDLDDNREIAAQAVFKTVSNT